MTSAHDLLKLIFARFSTPAVDGIKKGSWGILVGDKNKSGVYQSKAIVGTASHRLIWWAIIRRPVTIFGYKIYTHFPQKYRIYHKHKILDREWLYFLEVLIIKLWIRLKKNRALYFYFNNLPTCQGKRRKVFLVNLKNWVNALSNLLRMFNIIP